MDVMECNEAFAVQNLAVIKELENQTGGNVDMEKWKPRTAGRLPLDIPTEPPAPASAS